MRIIIENGELRIKGTCAERKAWKSVLEQLAVLHKHAGGDLATAAGAHQDATEGFLEALDADCEWAMERVKSVPTN